MPDISWQGDGFAVMSVVPDSPAATAGLQMGDVILQLGDDKISGRQDLARAIRKYGVDKEVPLRVRRGGEEITVTVILKRSR